MINDVNDDNRKRPIPTAFRASLDASDEAAHARLLAADEKQKEWSANVSNEFVLQTPHERMRQKAGITIESLEAAASANGLTKDQLEILAEGYATVGRYDLAANISKNRELYEKYWAAVHLDDSEWCEHVDKHKFIRETVWSVRDNCERPLLACNVCGIWNVADSPEYLLEARRSRAAVRSAAPDPTKHTIEELRQWHHDHARPGKGII